MTNIPSMDEMIADCEKKKTENEVIVFAIGAGRVTPMLGKRKAMKKAFNEIKKQKGFIGIHPIDLWRTLLLYDELNHAKAARNVLTSKGVQLGNICPVLIPKEHFNNARDYAKGMWE